MYRCRGFRKKRSSTAAAAHHHLFSSDINNDISASIQGGSSSYDYVDKMEIQLDTMRRRVQLLRGGGAGGGGTKTKDENEDDSSNYLPSGTSSSSKNKNDNNIISPLQQQPQQPPSSTLMGLAPDAASTSQVHVNEINLGKKNTIFDPMDRDVLFGRSGGGYHFLKPDEVEDTDMTPVVWNNKANNSLQEEEEEPTKTSTTQKLLAELRARYTRQDNELEQLRQQLLREEEEEESTTTTTTTTTTQELLADVCARYISQINEGKRFRLQLLREESRTPSTQELLADVRARYIRQDNNERDERFRQQQLLSGGAEVHNNQLVGRLADARLRESSGAASARERYDGEEELQPKLQHQHHSSRQHEHSLVELASNDAGRGNDDEVMEDPAVHDGINCTVTVTDGGHVEATVADLSARSMSIAEEKLNLRD